MYQELCGSSGSKSKGNRSFVQYLCGPSLKVENQLGLLSFNLTRAFCESVTDQSKKGDGLYTENVGYVIIKVVIIWLTDFACCDWSIPGP